MIRRVLSIGFLWGLASCALGASIVVVGNQALLPNTANQTIAINVMGSELVQGLNFRVQVEDGGPLPPAAGPPTGPVITAVDLITGTIFDGNVSEQTDLLSLEQIWVQSVTTQSGTVIADGLLARVTFDTTGFWQGSFQLALADTLDGPTDFAGIPIDITDGTLRVVPEPSAWMMALSACLVVMLVRVPSICRLEQAFVGWNELRAVPALPAETLVQLRQVLRAEPVGLRRRLASWTAPLRRPS